MATDRYTVIVDTKGAESNLNKLSGSVGGLKGALAGAFVVGGITAFGREVLRVGEAYEQMERKLSLVTGSQGELNGLLNTLNDISSRTFSSLQGTVELYQRLSVATGQLNLTTPELISLTERLQKAFKISGASAEEQARGITQLGQGLLEGKIRMEEFNTIMDTMGLGMVKVAEASGMTIGELRALVRDGNLTAEMFLDMIESATNLDEIFSGLSLTTDDVRTNLTGTFKDILKTINEATSASEIYKRSMISLNLTLADFFGTSQSLKDLKPEDIFKRVKEGTLSAEVALVDLQKRYLDTLGAFSGFGLFGSDERAQLTEFSDAIKELIETRQAEKEAAEAQLKVDKEQQAARAELLKPLTDMSGQLDAITKAYERNIPKSEKLTTEYDTAKETLAKLLAMRDNEIAQTPEYETALKTVQQRLAQLKIEMSDTATSTDAAAKAMSRLTDRTTDVIENLQKSTADMQFDLDKLNMNPLQKDIAEIERDIRTRVKKQIQELEAAMTPENAAQITAQINKLKDAASIAIQQQSELASQSYEHQRSFAYGWRKAFEQYSSDANNAANQAKNIFTTTTQGIEDAIVSFAKTGKFSLKEVGKDLSEQFLRNGIQSVISQLGGAGAGGSGSGGFFSNILGNLFGGGSSGGAGGGGNPISNMLGGLFGGGSRPADGSQSNPFYVVPVNGSTGGGGLNNILSMFGGAGSVPAPPSFFPKPTQSSGGGSIFGDLLGGIFGGGNSSSSSGGFFGGVKKAIGGIFGGLFANGGYLPAGQFGIVGERGPEMIQGPASITPGGGGSRSLQVTINAVDATSFQSLVASDPEFIYSVAQRGARSFV